MNNQGTWPEQNEVERWWDAHQGLLKRAVTAERLRVMKQRDGLLTFLKQLRECVITQEYWDRLPEVVRVEWNRVEREYAE